MKKNKPSKYGKPEIYPKFKIYYVRVNLVNLVNN